MGCEVQVCPLLLTSTGPIPAETNMGWIYTVSTASQSTSRCVSAAAGQPSSSAAEAPARARAVREGLGEGRCGGTPGHGRERTARDAFRAQRQQQGSWTHLHLEVLGDTAIQAGVLAHGELPIHVLGAHALGVAHARQAAPGKQRGGSVRCVGSAFEASIAGGCPPRGPRLLAVSPVDHAQVPLHLDAGQGLPRLLLCCCLRRCHGVSPLAPRKPRSLLHAKRSSSLCQFCLISAWRQGGGASS